MKEKLPWALTELKTDTVYSELVSVATASHSHSPTCPHAAGRNTEGALGAQGEGPI